jgi:CRISPR/Cas system-associated endoribonuclease Cas2
MNANRLKETILTLSPLGGILTIDERNARSRSNIQALLDDVQPEGQGTRETTPTIPHKRKRADWNWIPEQSNDRLISPRIEAHRGEDLETMEITRLEPSISESSQIPTFKELWVQLADVEHPPYNWDLHVSMGNLEKLRLNWSQNDVATSVIEGDLSSTDIDALKNALKKLSPNVRAILRDMKSDEDSNAVQDVISYMESLDEIEPEINNMENGPVKEAYTNLYSHFDSIGASKSKPNTVTTTLSESPRLSLEIEEVRIQLLQNFQQKEALTREGASSCRPPGGQSEGYAPCFAQKEVDRQLRTELNSQSPKMISRSRRFSKASRQIQASME